MVHHKFVVTDFNGKRPVVFTGSSNLAAGGTEENGDHLICIEDRRIAIITIEALRLFDHFHFRVKTKPGENAPPIHLAKPPTEGEDPWFASYYRKGHRKERDQRTARRVRVKVVLLPPLPLKLGSHGRLAHRPRTGNSVENAP
ncbi:hypothetical protein [Pseudomonas aeruginosa]|uniref:hypothetical protein n=1 Tax=Pseudomonas aeruginosa TaxID=287 RepID=UPI0033064AA2